MNRWPDEPTCLESDHLLVPVFQRREIVTWKVFAYLSASSIDGYLDSLS